MLSDKNLTVLTNIIGAVETGGQIYGKRRYNDYTAPYKNTPKEHTITLGWAQNYGHEAQKLIKMIYEASPEAFRAIDTAGIEKMLGKDWETLRWNPTQSQKQVLIKLIDSKIGHEMQDKLFIDKMKSIITECENTYTKDPAAVMMYCEIRHLGGKSAADRIFKRCNGNYSLENIMASLAADQKDKSSNNQVGDSKFWSRHVKCAQFIQEYADLGEKQKVMITAKDITICGHGSGTPSLKNLYTYSASRYSQKAPNGKRKGIVAVRRLKALTDAGRRKFVEAYKTILGRNTYNQNLREYVYKPYPKTGRYYSDCSSSICATFAKIGYNVPLLNTAGIYTSSLFETVPVTIKDGQIQNCEVLKVGDCILYRGNDPKRPQQIGHVEAVYSINERGESHTDDSTSVKTNVKKGQQWLNTNYGVLIKNVLGELLVTDGDYGEKTRWACLAVWKDLMNRKHGTKLTPSNKNFGDSCKKAAVNAVVAYGASGTFTYICSLILSAKGYYSGKMDAYCGDDLCKAIRAYEIEKKLTVDSSDPKKCECGPQVWYSLFN